MKRLLWLSVLVLGAGALVAPLAAGSSGAATSRPSPVHSATAKGPHAAKFLACMVTDTGGIDDRSFNASSWQGVQEAESATIGGKYLQSTSESNYVPNIDAFIAEKCGIIVTVGFLMGDDTESAAKAHPSQKFAIVDYTYSPSIKNIDALVFDTVQDGFLGGYLAAGMSKTHKVATFGGLKLPTVTIYMDGFWDGVQYYNRKHGTDVKVLGWSEATQNGSFTGDFTNQTKGEQLTATFISEGADIIFPVAGNVGLGAAKAVQDADASGGKVNMEWVDTDGCVSAHAVLQVLHHERDQGHPVSRQERDRHHGGGQVQGWQLHRHPCQRRRRPCALPRLREQGAGSSSKGDRGDQGRNRERQDPHANS